MQNTQTHAAHVHRRFRRAGDAHDALQRAGRRHRRRRAQNYARHPNCAARAAARRLSHSSLLSFCVYVRSHAKIRIRWAKRGAIVSNERMRRTMSSAASGRTRRGIPASLVPARGLTLPLVAAPMFLASGPALVSACCRAGVIGTFPSLNQRSTDGYREWLREIKRQNAAAEKANPGTVAPFGVNHIVHRLVLLFLNFFHKYLKFSVAHILLYTKYTIFTNKNVCLH